MNTESRSFFIRKELSLKIKIKYLKLAGKQVQIVKKCASPSFSVP